MNQQQTSLPDSTAVHPLDIFKPEWMVSRQSIQADSLIVEHDIQPPGEIDCSSLSTHLISFLLTTCSSRQVTRIDRQQQEHFSAIGDFFLQPATYSGFYSWNGTDECIAFIIEPDFLTRTAAATECLNPSKIELNPLVLGRDPTLEYIARSFLAEMQNDAIGGRIYSETLATQFAIHILRNYCTFPAQLKQYDKGLSRRQL